MKKLLITVATALSLLLPSVSSADIIFYKNGKVKRDVKSQEITLKLSSVSDDALKLDRDKILGIKSDEKGRLEVLLKDDTVTDYASTSDCLKIRIKDDKGNEETINGEDIEKYLFTNNVVPDKEIIKKYEFMKVANKYFKKLGLTPGESFSLYRDDVKERYILVSIDRLSMAKSYENMQIESSFDRKEIGLLEEKLKAEGKDTYLTIVASAGCSLTPMFVNYNDGYFVEVLFHEWWHENIRNLPVELDEATATVVGFACAEDFLSKYPKYRKNGLTKDRGIKDSKAYGEYSKKNSKAYGEYSKIVVEYYERLSKVYKSEMSDEEKLKAKEQILDEMKAKTGHSMNNAELSFAITYCRYFELADKVVEHYPDIKDVMKALKETPADSLEEGIKYLEDLLSTRIEKPKLELYY